MLRPDADQHTGVDYVVIARKYRPQTFAEVVGQDAIARTLANAIRKQRLGHGFLFTGPSGVGKTTMARILAKALQCVDGPTAEPCGICDQCRAIATSTHPDVFEIDAATHTGVDNVRDLSEGATYAPVFGRYRVYILDEAHMLSASSWNALLKVLEEPPAHVFFIFATTEVEKVPLTVVNRCQRFDFRSIGLDAVVTRLGEVAAGEGVDVEHGLLVRLARAAGGGMREAQTLLDQLLAMADQAPTGDDLDLLLGAARGGDLVDLVDRLLAGERLPALEALDRLLADGVAVKTLLGQLTDHFRQLLLITTCGAESPVTTRLGVVAVGDRERAAAAGEARLLRCLQVVLAAQEGLRNGVEARLQAELALIHLARLGDVVELDRLVQRLERLEAGGPAPTDPRRGR